MSKCTTCYWHGQCECDEQCDFYEPMELDSSEDYAEQLRMRSRAYLNIVNEQND